MTQAVNENGTYITPHEELVRRDEKRDILLLTKEWLRIAMWHDMGEPLGNAYLADVDKVWQVIADAVERGDL